MRYGPRNSAIQRSSLRPWPVSSTLSGPHSLTLWHKGTQLRSFVIILFHPLHCVTTWPCFLVPFTGLFATLLMKFVSQAGVHFCRSTINAIIHYPAENHPFVLPVKSSMVISAVGRSGNCRHPSLADIVQPSRGGDYGPRIRICISNLQLGHLAKNFTVKRLPDSEKVPRNQ